MKVRLRVQEGPRSFEHEYAGPVVTIGRNPAAHLVLEADSPESVASWDHARIDLSPREATITDLRSTNGTYRNGTAVSGTVPLWPNDVIRLGQTGPTMTVKMIDLTPAASPAPRRIAQGDVVASPTVAKPAKAARPQAAKVAPVISETRGIALQAVQDLMAQQEELRAQQDEQTRHRRTLLTVSLVAFALFLLLGGGFLWSTGRLHLLGRKTDELASGQDKIKEDVAGLADNMRKQAQDTAEHFGKIEAEQSAQLAKQNEIMAKIDVAAQQLIAQEAKIRGGLDKMKQEIGASLDDLNRRLAAKPQEMPPVAMPPPIASNAKKLATRIEPGMKLDVIMRDGVNTYRGVLLSIDGTMVRMQTIPDPAAKPSEFDMKKVQAFQTRDGIFAYNESTGEFVSAITYFKLNKSLAMFERSDDQLEPYRSEDAKVLGAVTVSGIWGKGPGGEWILGLPGAGSQSPPPMPAYQMKEIVTVKGVYTYDQTSREYTYKPHTQLAAEAREKRDEYWRQVDEKQWERRKQAYKLGTDRLRALAPYFGRRWW